MNGETLNLVRDKGTCNLAYNPQSIEDVYVIGSLNPKNFDVSIEALKKIGLFVWGITEKKGNEKTFSLLKRSVEKGKAWGIVHYCGKKKNVDFPLVGPIVCVADDKDSELKEALNLKWEKAESFRYLVFLKPLIKGCEATEVLGLVYQGFGSQSLQRVSKRSEEIREVILRILGISCKNDPWEKIEIEPPLSLLKRGNILLEGPPGIGKTSTLVRLKEKGVKTLIYVGNATWTEKDVIGGETLKHSTLAFSSGALLEAIVESCKGKTLLIFDEINRCDADKAFGIFFATFSGPMPHQWNLEVLEQFLERRKREMELDEIAKKALNILKYNKETIRQNLRIAATMNTVDYASTFTLGEALRRRFFPVLMMQIDIRTDEEDQWVVEFMRKVLEKSITIPIPMGKGALDLYKSLKEVLGIRRAFCSVFVPPSLELQPDFCEKVYLALREVEGRKVDPDELECLKRCKG
ncbi:hypothetical protein IPA_01705 [Ignicoccus pacificus DSM 13166]|uniref:AAA+ ATPase domain-containing protein n=1 Tax=Ignicoccus pacificus DSM 13166 TaxID=940294 RepID=A0A977KBL2_9CREN|nr:hypothetical protein IPA_01705 [Ignicoccus pacificus DSM 13166]